LPDSAHTTMLLFSSLSTTPSPPTSTHFPYTTLFRSSGTDYTATSGTLTFGPGQTAQNITVPILGRAGAAPTRKFTVVLSTPVNRTEEHTSELQTIGHIVSSALAATKISAPPDGIAPE